MPLHHNIKPNDSGPKFKSKTLALKALNDFAKKGWGISKNTSAAYEFLAKKMFCRMMKT